MPQPPATPDRRPGLLRHPICSSPRVVREESGRIVGALTASLGNLDIAEEAVADAVVEALREWRRARRAAESRWVAHAGGSAQRARPAAPRDAVPRQARAARRAGDRRSRSRCLWATRTSACRCCSDAVTPRSRRMRSSRSRCGRCAGSRPRRSPGRPSAPSRPSRSGSCGPSARSARQASRCGSPKRRERPERLDIVLTVVSVMYSEAHLVAGRRCRSRPRPRRRRALARPRHRRGAPARGRGAGAAGAAASSTAHGSPPAQSTASSCCWRGRTGRDGMPRSSPTRAPRSSARPRCAVRDAGSFTRRSRRATRMQRSRPTTDWLQVLTLYDMLLAYDRSPVVRLNRAVALARVEGPQRGARRGRRTRGPARALPPVARRARAPAARARPRRRGARRRSAGPRAHRERRGAPAARRAAGAVAAVPRAADRRARTTPSRRVHARWARHDAVGSARSGGFDAMAAGNANARAHAPTGVSACDTSRSSVVIPSRDRIDSRWPCTEA